MRAVVQNDKSRASRRLSRVPRATAVLAVAALAAGCAQDDTPEVRGAPGQQAPPARAVDGAAKAREARAALAAAAKRWDLKRVPLTAPAPPEKKPEIKPREGFEVDGQEEDDLPPVFTTVPTKEKVVFLTIDDGAEKDPAFLKMMSELKIPYTVFLTDEEIKDDYGYFKKMQARGVTLNNHTLSHPYLPALSYEEQKREICGMQDVMEKHYGKRPVLSARPTATTTATPCAPPSPAASSTPRSGARRCTSTTGSTASGTRTCTPATSSSPTSGAPTTGTAR
ncbi:hypothetical protein SVIOM342S_08940 [Streptomyces violaceorubidus]